MYTTKIFTVGGFGGFVASNIHTAVDSKIEIVAINTDKQALASLPDSVTKITISPDGFGSGANPALAYKLAEKRRLTLEKHIEGVDVAILVCGLGKGTGTGAGQYMAELLKEKGVYTIANIRMPGEFDGSTQNRIAKTSILKMLDTVDAHTVISNDTLIECSGKDTLEAAYAEGTQSVSDSILSLTSMINNSGVRNVDLNDFKAMIFGDFICRRHRGQIDLKSIERIGLDVKAMETAVIVFEVPVGQSISMDLFKQVTAALKAELNPEAEMITGIITNPDIDQLQVITALGFDKTLYQKRAQAGSKGGEISKR